MVVEIMEKGSGYGECGAVGEHARVKKRHLQVVEEEEDSSDSQEDSSGSDPRSPIAKCRRRGSRSPNRTGGNLSGNREDAHDEAERIVNTRCLDCMRFSCPDCCFDMATAELCFS